MVSRTGHLDVFGSFGFGNLGDEIVPSCLANLCSNAGADVTIRAFSRYDGIKVDRIVPFRDFLRSPLPYPILLCGGGIIENHSMSCLNRAMERCKHDPHVEMLPFAISVEPGVRFSLWDQWRLRKQVQDWETIYVRDSLSARTLKRLSPRSKIEVIGDIGLWCRAGDLPLKISNLLPEKYAVVIISDNWIGEDFISWISQELSGLARDADLALVFLPISLMEGEDVQVSERVVHRIKAIDSRISTIKLTAEDLTILPSPEIVSRILSDSMITIAMRLHGCIMSFAQRTPFIALAYHPKLVGFAETVGWERAVVPGVAPQRQSGATYGYRFSDLGLRPGCLREAAIEAMQCRDFSALDYFRNRQSEVIQAVLS